MLPGNFTDICVSGRDVLRVEWIGHRPPVIVPAGDMRKIAVDRNGCYIRNLFVSVESRIGPVANGIESPCPQSLERGGLPFRLPIGAVFSFQIRGIKSKGLALLRRTIDHATCVTVELAQRVTGSWHPGEHF